MRKSISVILAILMLLSIIPVTAGATTITANGTCGANIEWTLDSDGKLTILGNGEMYDFDFGNMPPWFSYCEKISEIIFDGYITSIGDWAFTCCDSLLAVNIPDSVKSIGFAAFEDCDNITTISIGKSVVDIEEYAFNLCPSLVNITIPESVKNIEYGAFLYCINLNRISVDENNTHYSSDENGVLFDKDKINLITYPAGNTNTTYTIPKSVITINENAFYQCDSLENLTISNSVTNIEHSAFVSCDNLSEIYYYGSEEQWNEISIGYDNTNLTNATIYYNYCSINNSFEHNYKSVVTVPTCKEQGFTTYTCACGNRYISDYADAKGHSHTSTITTPATHLTEGVMTFACECGDIYTETIEKLEEHTHKAVVTTPTCMKQGFTTYTCACGDSYVSDYMDIVEHKDTDKDGLCDFCDSDMAPEDGGNTNNCSHMCHQSGFVGFIWKIIQFFWKLFNMNPVCECGAAHY